MRPFTFLLVASAIATGIAFLPVLMGKNHLEFRALAIPTEPVHQVLVTDSARAGHDRFDVSFEPLVYSGTEAGDVFGRLRDARGNPMPALLDGDNLPYSNNPDGSTWHVRGQRIFLLSQFEDRPGGVFISEFRRSDKQLKLLSTAPVDFSSVGGTHTNCAASLTPWGTHLAPEEDYEMDGIAYSRSPEVWKALGNDRSIADLCRGGKGEKNEWLCKADKGMSVYLNGRVNPYNYGYQIELRTDDNGKVSIVGNSKHYLFGKYSPEMAIGLPDQRTFIASDDGINRGLFMLVADRPGDLTSGTLYMAHWRQRGTDSGDLSWIRLGTSTEAQVRSIVEKRPDFADMFEIREARTNSLCKASGLGFRLVAAGDYTVCVRPRDGVHAPVAKVFADSAEARLALAFLETRRYGSWLGATTEFNKEEGLEYDPDHNLLYIAHSDISKGMTAAKDPEKVGADDIRMSENVCGGIFRVALGKAADQDKRKIDSEYVPIKSTLALAGEVAGGNDSYCVSDKIASPDNLRYYRGTLLIGEDTKYHRNNLVWAWPVHRRQAIPVLAAPWGAEITGTFALLDMPDGVAFLANMQHPALDPWFAAGSKKPLKPEEVTDGRDTRRRGVTGIIRLRKR